MQWINTTILQSEPYVLGVIYEEAAHMLGQECTQGGGGGRAAAPQTPQKRNLKNIL
jgi:hypothetical protein